MTGRPVKARPIDSQERLRRWVRRNPALAAMSVLALALFAGGAVSVCWQWRRAERSLVEVQEQKDRATSHLLAAQNAVDELLTGIAAEMRDLPQTETIRLRLLNRAAVINQRFLQDESVDPAEAGLDSIKAWRRSADIFLQLGDLAQTEKSLRRLIELCESLSKREQSAEVVDEYVTALCTLSGVADARNDWQNSNRILQGGLAMLDAQPEKLSTDIALWRGEILRRLGINAERQNQLNEAGQYYQQAVEQIGQREATAGDSIRQIVSQAKIHGSYAIHCKQRNRFDEAMQHFDKAQSALEMLRERRPDDAEYQAMIAMNQYNMANLDLVAERYDLARSRYLNAKNDFKQLAASFPRVIKYRDLWCHSLQGATLASKQPDQLDNRILMLKKAAFLREEILRDNPELPDNAAQLKGTYRRLGRDYVLARQYDDARRCFRRSIECDSDATSSAAQQKDRLDDASACSLMARLEMKCRRWPEAQDWFERAIATRKSGRRQSDTLDKMAQADQFRDTAGRGLAIARAGRVEEGWQIIRQLPASNSDTPDTDLIAAKAMVNFAECLEDRPAENESTGLRPRDIQLEAIARLRSAWECGHPDIHYVVSTVFSDLLGDVPEFQQLVEELESDTESAGLKPAWERE